MDLVTARRLNDVNKEFYAAHAASFSATRQAPWPGWQRCLDIAWQEGLLDRGGRGGSRDAMDPDAKAPFLATAPSLAVLDLACGNLRFGRFLAQDLDTRGSGRMPVRYLGVDATPAMADLATLPAGWDARLANLDIVDALLAGTFGRELAAVCPDPVDLAVAFGFLHHVPTFVARRDLLRALLERTRPGGLCCVSLWRFMSDDGLADRARATTEEALAALGLSPDDLDPGDCLLGWQGEPGVWRYCHDFDAAEADALAEAVADLAEPAARFCDDGRTGALNGYLVLRRR